MATDSRDEVRQRISSLYDRAEDETGNFNATRAMARATRTRGVPLAKRPERRSDPALDEVAKQWFEGARAKLGPSAPAVLPADRMPGRRAAPARSSDRTGGDRPGGDRETPGRGLPELPAGPSGTGARALPELPRGAAAEPTARPVPELTSRALPELTSRVMEVAADRTALELPGRASAEPPNRAMLEPAGRTSAPTAALPLAASPAIPQQEPRALPAPATGSRRPAPAVSKAENRRKLAAARDVLSRGIALRAVAAQPTPAPDALGTAAGQAPRPTEDQWRAPQWAAPGVFPAQETTGALGTAALPAGSEPFSRPAATAPLTDTGSFAAPVPAGLPADTGSFAAPLPADTGSFAAPLPTDTGSFAAPLPTDTGSFAAPLPSDTGSFAAPFPTDTGSFAAPLPSDTGSFAAPVTVGTGSFTAPLPTDTGAFAAPAIADTGSFTAPVTAGAATFAPPAPPAPAPAPAAPLPTETGSFTAPLTTTPTTGTGSYAPVAPTPQSPRALRAEKAIAFARAQIGKPCVWGAMGPDSYDCSSLTQAAWKAAGVTLPRAAHQQALGGSPVTLAALEPGDLVLFFDDDRHVGLHTGNGMMIHAPGPGSYICEESIYGAGEAAIHRVIRPA
ncbi:NlpC/P60 family protein [Streptomyces sp. NPDC017958]|uniref:C40 family peptidase n=1 Tax=Streptomyces sp. NPDC017958 TaxID=3365021 RepID=UPI0037AC20CD